jgi:hypothetical protein
MRAIQFLQDNIDAKAKISPLSMKKKLSPALNYHYAFWQLDLLGNSYLLANPRDDFTVARLSGNFAEIEVNCGLPVIFYIDTLSAYLKKRLLAEHIPFLLSDKQFYLPFLGMNISSKDKPILPIRTVFSPATHTVFLYLLYADSDCMSQQDIQKTLGFSAITVSRAVAELKALNLLEIKVGGKTNRKQEVIIADRKEFYHQGLGFFGRVIKQTIYCVGRVDNRLLLGGLSALSKRTMLNPPTHDSYVFYSRSRKLLSMRQVNKEEYLDTEEAVLVNLLSYDPSRLALDGIADPITMMFTLGERDERIDKEFSVYMKRYEWYLD